jgi:hypothetical protein
MGSTGAYTQVVRKEFHPGGSKRILGVVLIAALIMIFTIARFYHSIPWGSR